MSLILLKPPPKYNSAGYVSVMIRDWSCRVHKDISMSRSGLWDGTIQKFRDVETGEPSQAFFKDEWISKLERVV